MGGSPVIARVLAGIETGVLGGAAMMAWLAASALLAQRPVWAVPNLLGTVLAGDASLASGFGWVTVSGLGLLLAVAGVAGLLFGLMVGSSRNRVRVALLGIIAGLSLYYGAQYVLWRKLGIYLTVYTPPRPTLLAFLLYGLVLGWVPGARQRIETETSGTPAAPEVVE